MPDTHIEAVALKKKMISDFKYIGVMYYVVAILYEFYIAMYTNITYFNDNEYLREWVYLAKGASNLFLFTWLLWVFRPRKEWPEHFTLEIGEVGGR